MKQVLTAAKLTALLRAAEPSKYTDGGGMHLFISNTGAASWRYKYRIAGKEKLFTLGTANGPDCVSLAEARSLLADARAQVKKGHDPVAKRRVRRLENTSAGAESLKELAEDWLDRMAVRWSAKHASNSRRAFKRDIYPSLGNLPLTDVTTPMVSATIAKVEKRAPETSRRIRQHLHSVFDYGRVKGLITINPVVTLPGATVSTGKLSKRLPAFITLPELGGVLRDAERHNLSAPVREASWLLAHTVVRVSELVAAQWPEFQLTGKSPRWVIPRSRMKTQSLDRDHIIPLSPKVVTRLVHWRTVIGGGKFVFPSTQSKTGHISIESIEKAYRVTLGLKDRHVPHGWRSAFSSLAHDALDKKGMPRFDHTAIETSLDHLVGSKVQRAYDRGDRWDARCALMTWWSLQLETAMNGANVIQFKTA